jgi:hypothetical protein
LTKNNFKFFKKYFERGIDRGGNFFRIWKKPFWERKLRLGAFLFIDQWRQKLYFSSTFCGETLIGPGRYPFFLQGMDSL